MKATDPDIASPCPPEMPAAALAERERIGNLFAQARRARPIGWVLVFSLVAVFGPQAGVARTAGWVLLMVAALMAAVWRQRGFDAAVASGEWQPLSWATRLRHGVVLASLALGSAMWFFYREEQGNLRYLLLMLLLATAAGSINAYGHDAPTMRACLLALAAPMLAWMLLMGLQRQAGIVGALLFCFYIAMLLRFGQNHANLLADSIRMRHEQRDLVLRLQRKTREAEQAMRAKSAFFAAASHDLRQPVQALQLYLGLLGTPDEPPQLRDSLRACVQALGGLFDDILGIAVIDAGKLQPQIAPLRLQTLVDRLATVHAATALHAGLRLRWRIPSGAVVNSDAQLLQRILGNLLCNALRHTRQGGVLVAARRRGSNWSLVVVDTGVGIAEADQARVWDEFVQLGNPQRDPAQGVGLGLPTVRRLATLLGHPLRLRSRPGHGSWFELQLPALSDAPDCAAACPDPSTVPSSAALSGRALVIDDHTHARQALVLMLQQWGLVCDSAADAHQALALADRHAYDLLLCDQRLPGNTDGLALLARLQAQQPSARLAALISADPAPIQQAPDAPLWLAKPLRPARLRALLISALTGPLSPVRTPAPRPSSAAVPQASRPAPAPPPSAPLASRPAPPGQ